MKGELRFYYNRDSLPDQTCQCEVTPVGSTVFSPSEGQQHLPEELKNERYHQVATHIVHTYYNALVGKPAYIWVDEVTHATSSQER